MKMVHVGTINRKYESTSLRVDWLSLIGGVIHRLAVAPVNVNQVSAFCGDLERVDECYVAAASKFEAALRHDPTPHNCVTV
jgi:hypothetical protein